MSSSKKDKNRIPIPGSERTALPGARVVGTPDPNERINVTVVVRPRPTSKGLTSIKEMSILPPKNRKYLSREEFAATEGADPDDLAKVEAFAHAHGLDLVEVSPARRSVVLSGTVSAMSAAFEVELKRYEHPKGTYRGRTGPIHIPTELASIVQAVLGLDNRPQAKPHFRRFEKPKGVRAHAVEISYTPPQLAQLYDFPIQVNGQGQCIAIIELGGGYRTDDLNTYFTRIGIPNPAILFVSIDNGQNQPTTSDSADGEVMLDIEVAGAVAPGAKIVVYFAPNTDQGFLDAITTAIHDTQNKPSVISISWGASESGWTNQAMQAMDQAFQAAAALGVTICCASGDNGSSDGVTDDNLAHVDFPASSPYVLACGGTHLESSSTTITNEAVWNDPGGGATGGGVSDVFDLPSWQANVNVPPSVNPGGRVGRGVPDVAGDADPGTGYQVLVDGQQLVFGGTSAVAPLWAGLIVLINQQLGQPVGYLNPLIYGLSPAAGAFHDITTGNNGAYQAGAGWDACTGLGSPDGAKLLSALSK